MKTNYFLTGNAAKILKTLPSNSIDLICTDPPYNLGKNYGNHIDKKDGMNMKSLQETGL